MTPTLTELKNRFEEYNKLYFGGQLGKCKFGYIYKSCGAYGKYSLLRKSNGTKESNIYICLEIKWSDELLKNTLIHEMVHMYVATIDGVEWDGVIGHGRYFRRQCKRLKKEFGLIITAHGTRTNDFPPSHLWERILLWVIDR